MAQLRLTKSFEFEMAHALSNYKGYCKNIHGHSYKLFVTVKGMLTNEKNNPVEGMIMDFSELDSIVRTNIIDKYDHALVLCERHNKNLITALEKEKQKMILLPVQPTCENLLVIFSKILEPQLPRNISLCKLKLQETASNYTEWLKEENL